MHKLSTALPTDQLKNDGHGGEARVSPMVVLGQFFCLCQGRLDLRWKEMGLSDTI